MPAVPSYEHEIFEHREPLRNICEIPDKIISVYTLEQHIWAGESVEEHDLSRQLRIPEPQTVKEFQINPVRVFLSDILRQMAAPYRPERRDMPVGQGYWIQAEFGSGKSHLLCFLAALGLGDKDIWEQVQEKEEKIGRGRRESLYRFWEEGIREKGLHGKRGILVVAKTLVGSGGGTVGMTGSNQQRLIDYIIEATREQLRIELNKNISLYPVELLADRFLKEDLERYCGDLKKFLRDPRFFAEDEQETLEDFLDLLQSNASSEDKRQCGTTLWRFYDEYLKMRPHLATEPEEVLKHLVEMVLAEGYTGMLLVLDEVSLFMKNRDDKMRIDDEQTLVVLSNRLTRVHNLPLWTVCSAQQAIESRMGVKNIIADDRLKEIILLKDNDEGYYEIALTRVREIIDPDAIDGYYLYYKKHFSWAGAFGKEQFHRFFPFHRPALEVLRSISVAGLTSERSTIHFMHETLKRLMNGDCNELISLGHLFEKTVTYEEDPSGMSEGLAAVKLKWEVEYQAYITCERQIIAQPRGLLKIYNDRALKILQTLFLYQIARLRLQGLNAEELANTVLQVKDEKATPDINNNHYLVIARTLSTELPQVIEAVDEEDTPHYRFDPVFSSVDPRHAFNRARDEAEANESFQQDAWLFLLGLTRDGWAVKTQRMRFDLANGHESLFAAIAPDHIYRSKNAPLDINWQGRIVSGFIEMRDIVQFYKQSIPLPALQTVTNDQDFALYVSMQPVPFEIIEKLLQQRNDPRILIWTPDEFTDEERRLFYDLTAYRRLISLWEQKDTNDAAEIINWVARSLQTEMGKIVKIIESRYGRGRIHGLSTMNMTVQMGGGLISPLTPIIGRVLSSVYESRDISFSHSAVFRKEEAVKVINGIVRLGEIPRYTKPNQDISAVQNFGLGLGVIRRGAERKLDVSGNRFVAAITAFIEQKLGEEGLMMPIEAIYKNFMGTNIVPNYGLPRRLIQLYLLCLVQTGKIRLTVSSKAGLSNSTIDYTTIKTIDFSARILDNLVELHKMTRPKNWDTLRPFVEALLNITISATYDDAMVTKHRADLRTLFREERDESQDILSRTRALFAILEVPNPYQRELEQFVQFFTLNLGDDEIDQILLQLAHVFQYTALEEEQVVTGDVDDFRNRLKKYRDLQQFISHADDLRLAHIYSTLTLPNEPFLEQLHQAQRELVQKLHNLQTHIDSDVLLRTDLIGRKRFDAAQEKATLSRFIIDYADVYVTMHTRVIKELDERRSRIKQMLSGPEMQVLKLLERVPAFQPVISQTLTREIEQIMGKIFSCPIDTSIQIKESLLTAPVHACNLTLENYQQQRQIAEQAEHEATQLFAEALQRRLEVFFNSTIQDRLQQGRADTLINDLLACHSVQELQDYLIQHNQAQGTLIVERLQRYLKRIAVKKVQIAAFHPTKNLIEQEQIPLLVKEFQAFLEGEIHSLRTNPDDDILPMLEIE